MVTDRPLRFESMAELLILPIAKCLSMVCGEVMTHQRGLQALYRNELAVTDYQSESVRGEGVNVTKRGATMLFQEVKRIAPFMTCFETLDFDGILTETHIGELLVVWCAFTLFSV